MTTDTIPALVVGLLLLFFGSVVPVGLHILHFEVSVLLVSLFQFVSHPQRLLPLVLENDGFFCLLPRILEEGGMHEARN